MIKIKKGLDLPLSGSPQQGKPDEKNSSTVGLLGDDYIGLRPSFLVEAGASLKKGQKIFEDKSNLGVFFTSPVSGILRKIHRGERRRFISLEIEVKGREQVVFSSFSPGLLKNPTRISIQELLLESGLWTAIRTRPYSKTPILNTSPSAIFVNAMDTQPHAPSIDFVLSGKEDVFYIGLRMLRHLTEGPLYLVTHPESKLGENVPEGVVHQSFSGPHPAGNVGTHIHFLHPVSSQVQVWHVGAQDVLAIGYLFKTGELYTDRIVSLAGPMVKNPRLLKVTMGAEISELLSNEVREEVRGEEGEVRKISGSVLNGRKAEGITNFLGRFHSQISLLEEGRKREFLGWQSPGLNKFSIKPIFLSRLLPHRFFSMNTNLNGSHRAIVPIGSYEKVMPLNIFSTLLYRQLLAKNWENSKQLGALELDEEDLALSTFVDPCKNDFGQALREVLTLIEKEG